MLQCHYFSTNTSRSRAFDPKVVRKKNPRRGFPTILQSSDYKEEFFSFGVYPLSLSLCSIEPKQKRT